MGSFVYLGGLLDNRHYDEWFHSLEWQTKEREADITIKKGDVSGPFTTVSSLLKHLKKSKRHL